jgi:putative DNA methylase
MMDSMLQKRKLIEVALPLEAINKASGREKSIRHGHPSTLHLWWARRPLAAARAVIFGQMVDDPSSHPEVFATEEAQEAERQRLFRLIEELVLWENTTNEALLAQARDEIWKSWRATCAENIGHPRAAELFNPEKLPSFHDPFAGGGTLPLEAQRLGLETYATDLNPVAVLINKATIEIPPKFADKPPVNAQAREEKSLIDKPWRGVQGLAEDVRYYGRWMRDEAEKRIGDLYPPVEVTAEMASLRPDLKPLLGRKLTVIAWLWARTVKSPNPAFSNTDVPLVATFMLSTKPGKPVYVEPMVERDGYRFTVKVGEPEDLEVAKNGTKLARGAHFRCVMSGTPIAGDYIKAEGKAGRMGSRLMAIVAEGEGARIYLPPTDEMEAIARRAKPEWIPEGSLIEDARAFTPYLYGFTKWADLFTQRQLVALTTFSDLVQEARERVQVDALAAGFPDDGRGIEAGGDGATAYSDAIAVYLGLTASKAARFTTALSTWRPDETKLSRAFTRNDIPMTWDFAETNPFSGTGGDIAGLADGTSSVILQLPIHPAGFAQCADACSAPVDPSPKILCTDPPYYDNVPYADLSDYFYVWLRHSLRRVLPDLFATLAVPKAEELVATPYRHGGKEKAEAFFLEGMTRAMQCLADEAHVAFPVIIYYAFKQSESNTNEGTSSTGWETFLEAVINAGFAINGTWPLRTEGRTRMRSMGSNALASSIVLICRPRTENVPIATRREFLSALKAELPLALGHLQRSNIAPVDLAQSAIGPGMAIFTRYADVVDAEGRAMSVREALALINQVLDEVLAEQEGDFDADSRWALAWFEQYGFAEGEYGVAETLSKAKNTSVRGLFQGGILASKGGKVRLFQPGELSGDWNPATDPRLSVWEIVHHLIRALEVGGESAAADLMAKIGALADTARELPYRLYTICERKKRAREALSYNGLVQSWPEIARLARETSTTAPSQTQMFEQV